ncbi:MAG: UDP-2,4-diacetamido-2,4,6-trideoxy-beta-L-altropyranose hydrolase [Leptospiraceae bacterium]|nr:UDP-2,4-diacetamido-2,4,6-trideoxy-beta-L-altropyranose hydrolase [Leptospiraceae bacterium]MBP9164422.1 UDP-2,4-diacetamido-2,4,6-trideoxy-beta-L-altropyranose hydrolase [Leptospiraceae bacterium]
MSVFIFTECLSSTGLGHLGRCTALTEILIESGLKVELILHSDGTGVGKNTPYPIHILDWKNPEILNSLLVKYNISIAFVDSYLASENIYEIICKRVKKLISIDDTNRIPYPDDSIILNPGFGGNYIDYARNPIQILSGAEFTLLREPFRKKFTIPEIREKIQSVLITVGGEDRLNLVPKILNWLNRKYPEWKKQVLVGPAFKNLEEISDSQSNNIIFHENLDATAIRDLMLSVDMAITAGGQTTYELARCGTPMVMIEVVCNQGGNIRGFNELGVPSLMGYEDNVEFINQLSELVKKLDSKEKRNIQRQQFNKIENNRLMKWVNDYLCKI